MSNKFKIAQAMDCVNRLERYINGLDALTKMMEVITPFSQYNKLPDEFKVSHKRSLKDIEGDLKSMRAEAWDLLSSKRDKVRNLSINEQGDK